MRVRNDRIYIFWVNYPFNICIFIIYLFMKLYPK